MWNGFIWLSFGLGQGREASCYEWRWTDRVNKMRVIFLTTVVCHVRPLYGNSYHLWPGLSCGWFHPWMCFDHRVFLCCLSWLLQVIRIRFTGHSVEFNNTTDCLFSLELGLDARTQFHGRRIAFYRFLKHRVSRTYFICENCLFNQGVHKSRPPRSLKFFTAAPNNSGSSVWISTRVDVLAARIRTYPLEFSKKILIPASVCVESAMSGTNKIRVVIPYVHLVLG